MSVFEESISTDEAGDLQRQVVGDGVESPKRRKLAREILNIELQNRFRAAEVLEPVFA
jgi:hypothetical protein